MSQGLAADSSPEELLARYRRFSERPAGIGRLFPKPLLLGDHVLHEIDIVHALGRVPTVEPEVVAAVLQTEVTIPNPFVPAKRTAAGLRLVTTDSEWRHESRSPVAEVTGPGWAIASVLGNRPKALSMLKGDGVELLAHRLAANGNNIDSSDPSRTPLDEK